MPSYATSGGGTAVGSGAVVGSGSVVAASSAGCVVGAVLASPVGCATDVGGAVGAKAGGPSFGALQAKALRNSRARPTARAAVLELQSWPFIKCSMSLLSYLHTSTDVGLDTLRKTSRCLAFAGEGCRWVSVGPKGVWALPGTMVMPATWVEFSSPRTKAILPEVPAADYARAERGTSPTLRRIQPAGTRSSLPADPRDRPDREHENPGQVYRLTAWLPSAPPTTRPKIEMHPLSASSRTNPMPDAPGPLWPQSEILMAQSDLQWRNPLSSLARDLQVR